MGLPSNARKARFGSKTIANARPRLIDTACSRVWAIWSKSHEESILEPKKPYFTLTFGSTDNPGLSSWLGSSLARLVKSMRTGTRCTTFT